MKVAVYSRLIKDRDVDDVQQFFDLLQARGHEALVFKEYLNEIHDKIKLKGQVEAFEKHEDIAGEAEFLISLGGDGTMLDTVSLVKNSGIPIFGINIGRLGFLATIGMEEIDTALTALEHGTHALDQRSLIHLESSIPLFGDVNYALNDFTLHKKDTSSMITIHTFLNGEYMNTYWADGLIVSTPTGSTGYSLSCGGPVIYPNTENFVITPVAPHNLNIRSLVVSNENVISFEIEGRSESFLCTLDSRYAAIDASVQLAVRKANFKINMVRLSDQNFLTTLRNKIMWGVDARN